MAGEHGPGGPGEEDEEQKKAGEILDDLTPEPGEESLGESSGGDTSAIDPENIENDRKSRLQAAREEAHRLGDASRSGRPAVDGITPRDAPAEGEGPAENADEFGIVHQTPEATTAHDPFAVPEPTGLDKPWRRADALRRGIRSVARHVESSLEAQRLEKIREWGGNVHQEALIHEEQRQHDQQLRDAQPEESQLAADPTGPKASAEKGHEAASAHHEAAPERLNELGLTRDAALLAQYLEENEPGAAPGLYSLTQEAMSEALDQLEQAKVISGDPAVIARRGAMNFRHAHQGLPEKLVHLVDPAQTHGSSAFIKYDIYPTYRDDSAIVVRWDKQKDGSYERAGILAARVAADTKTGAAKPALGGKAGSPRPSDELLDLIEGSGMRTARSQRLVDAPSPDALVMAPTVLPQYPNRWRPEAPAREQPVGPIETDKAITGELIEGTEVPATSGRRRDEEIITAEIVTDEPETVSEGVNPASSAPVPEAAPAAPNDMEARSQELRKKQAERDEDDKSFIANVRAHGATEDQLQDYRKSIERMEQAELQRGRLFPNQYGFKRFEALNRPEDQLDMGVDSGFEQGESLRIQRTSGQLEYQWIFMGIDPSTGLAEVAHIDETGKRLYKDYSLDDLRKLNPAKDVVEGSEAPSASVPETAPEAATGEPAPEKRLEGHELAQALLSDLSGAMGDKAISAEERRQKVMAAYGRAIIGGLAKPAQNREYGIAAPSEHTDASREFHEGVKALIGRTPVVAEVDVAPAVPEIPSSGRVFEMGPGPTRPEAVPLTPEVSKEPRRFNKEYSIEDKADDGSFTVFSDLVHEVQRENEKFGIPTSGQLTKEQALKLADAATTVEQLDALAGEYLRRVDKLRKDKQLFEKRQPGKVYEPQQVGAPVAENKMLGVYIERRKAILRGEERTAKREAGKRKTAAVQAGRVFDRDDAWYDSQDILRSSSENLRDRVGPDVPRVQTAESGDEDVRARINGIVDQPDSTVSPEAQPLPEYSRYGDEMEPGDDRTVFSELVDRADIAVTREGQLSDEQVAALVAAAESTDDVEAIMRELTKRGDETAADNAVLNERYEAFEKLEQIEDDYHEDDDDLSDGGDNEPEPDIGALLAKLESNFSEEPAAATPEQSPERVDTAPAKLIDQLGSTYVAAADSAAQVRRRGSILAAAIKAGYARPSAQGFLGVTAPRVETEQSRAFMAGLEGLKSRAEAEAEPGEN